MSRSFNQEVSLWQPETQAKLEKWTTKQKELLANAWNMTGSERKAIQSPALQSKRWRRNLVEDGDIEPNPGPCCCRFWNINTRGRDGAYKVLDLLRETKPHIVALQETNFDEVESEQFTRTASGCGYRAWHSTRPHVWTHLENHCREVECLCWFEQMCKQCITKLFLVTMVRYWPWTSAPFV